MSNQYSFVQWNRHKKLYDLFVLIGVLLVLIVGVGASAARGEAPDPMVALIRGLGVTALLMLHVILSIGPLARLDDRFSALLYNRRHLGVAFFLVVLAHAALVMLYYGGFGAVSPGEAVFVGSVEQANAAGRAPFEWFGLGAFLIFFVMAATSHDFWLKNLGPRFWKTLHMLVYAAYALVVLHVAFGSARDHSGALMPAALAAGAGWLGVLHVVAGLKQLGADANRAADVEGWVEVPSPETIPEGRARVVPLPGGSAAAVFKDRGRLTAMSNVCAHQGGPLGEGKVVDGCATCPWHGYQYRTEDACSPPPYTEKLATYELRIDRDRVLLNPEANAPGTPVEPVTAPETSSTPEAAPDAAETEGEDA